MIKEIIKKLLNKPGFQSGSYWEARYAKGGNSGDGSYGRLSEFKADIINAFLKEKSITSALELGCGDGHQLSLMNYQRYIGLDISASAVALCSKKFAGDSNKSFHVYEPLVTVKNKALHVDLALSLDVIYHVVEKNNYISYLQDLFSFATKYVIVYSTNYNEVENTHVVHRKFTEDVAALCPGWKLAEEIKNAYPGTGVQESLADFFIFEKIKN